MRQGLEVLRAEGWPPVFAYVYDEFWMAGRVPSLARLLAAILGPRYRQVSDVWCFDIPARRGASGFAPHTDDLSVDDPRRRLTVWVPISNATLENGCMYVIPRGLVAADRADRFSRDEFLTRADASALLQASRALPTPPGSLLGWDYSVVHWGSVCGATRERRVSFAFAFIAESAKAEPRECPLLDPGDRLPTLT
jgi:ectoine hydroxylase-related dioxygenase (phytanoyl-CoA dioxygenase family)